jgi:ubiquitin-conjugating enzyme E2 O
MDHQLRLDGLVEVTLVDGTVASFPLDRLTKLYDGMDQLEDIWGDEVFTESGSEFTDEVMEIISEDPPLPGEDEGGEWEDVEDDEMDTDQDWSVDAEAPHPPPDSLPESGAATPQPPVSNISSEAVAAQGTDGTAGVNPQPTEGSNSAAEAPFERFEVLSSAPADHAFLSTTPSQPSKNFMTRLTKEYRVLASSLPCLLLSPSDTRPRTNQ